VREFNKLSILSDFESSNIGICVQNKREDRMNILLKSDTNTNGCIHWFYFLVVVKSPCTMTFSIMNNKRQGQLFKEGMQISVRDSL